MQALELAETFFEILDFPEYARPEFIINCQKQSPWSKAVYLTTLSEIYHQYKIHFTLRFNKANKKNEVIKLEQIEISIKDLSGIESSKFITLHILDEIYSAIQIAWRMEKVQQDFSPYEILSFVEVALIFIKQEFNEQIKKPTRIFPRPRTKSYFTYLIAQNAPFFNYPVFKSNLRKLLFASYNLPEVKKVLKSFHKSASEIVQLWNEELFFIEEKSNSDNVNIKSDVIRIEFHSESLNYTWWADAKLFENISHKFYMNQDLAFYAANIANLVNDDIIHGKEIHIKSERKNFIDDFVTGIKKLLEQGNSETSILNILDKRYHEKPFRDFFSTWFDAKGYSTNRESLKGSLQIDLKVEHPSIEKKILEFKGWWHKRKKLVIQQLSNYLTLFDQEGYICIINQTNKSIEDPYQKMVTEHINGYIKGSWKKIRFKSSPFYYYTSNHRLDIQTKSLFHFIIDIEFLKQVHNTPIKKTEIK